MQQYGINNYAYSAAIYCRFSKDDGRVEDSSSIQTQKMMLEKFCMEQGYSIYEVYIDDGYSGLNYERPDFQRLLNDIDSGKVNLVVTKDLSRLGRDYIQTGYYTDIYFQRKGAIHRRQRQCGHTESGQRHCAVQEHSQRYVFP